MITATMDLSDFADLGKIWVGWGGVWGGAFKDPIHFELPGFPHKEIQASVKTFADKVVDTSNEVPWYVSMWLPQEASVTQAPHSSIAKRLLKDIGFRN